MTSEVDAAIWCAGKVSSLYTAVSGELTVDWGFQPIQLCNVNSDVTFPAPNGFVGYKTCQAILSEAVTAQATSRDFLVLLPNDNACTGMFNNGGPSLKWLFAFRVDKP